MSVGETGPGWLERSPGKEEEEENHGTNACERKNRTAYSDLVIVALVLHVLVKLFLRVKLNPTHLQLLPYLQHKTKAVNKQHTSVTRLHLSPQITQHSVEVLGSIACPIWEF